MCQALGIQEKVKHTNMRVCGCPRVCSGSHCKTYLLLRVTVKKQSSHHCFCGFAGMPGYWSVWLLPVCQKVTPRKAQASVPNPFQHKGKHRQLYKRNSARSLQLSLARVRKSGKKTGFSFPSYCSRESRRQVRAREDSKFARE